MYYELYVDVLFLVNFVMDYIILLFVWKVLHCETKMLRIFAGAVIGALLTCILILLPIPSTFLETLLFHLIVNTCMIRVGLKIKNKTIFLRAFILLYVGTILMGGILEALNQYIKIGSLLFVFAILGYYLSLGIWNFLSKLQRWNSTRVKVKIVCQGQELELDALIDTGNSLYDPVTGKPVSIISNLHFQKISHESKEQCYIFVKTLTNTESYLPLICAEKMWVHGEQDYYFQYVLFAVADKEFSKNGAFQVILNPNLF